MLKNDNDRKMILLQFRINIVHHLQGENFSRETPLVQLKPDEKKNPSSSTDTEKKLTRKCRFSTTNIARKKTDM